jgi:hypothetical protein
VRELGDEDLALLAHGAGDQRDRDALRGVVAIVAPVPMVSSSGWACTSSSRRGTSSGVMSIASAACSTAVSACARTASAVCSWIRSPGSGAGSVASLMLRP